MTASKIIYHTSVHEYLDIQFTTCAAEFGFLRIFF